MDPAATSRAARGPAVGPYVDTGGGAIPVSHGDGLPASQEHQVAFAATGSLEFVGEGVPEPMRIDARQARHVAPSSEQLRYAAIAQRSLATELQGVGLGAGRVIATGPDVSSHGLAGRRGDGHRTTRVPVLPRRVR